MIIDLDMSTDFVNRFQLPSLSHPFGTDFVGNDLFQQMVHGTADVLYIGIMASLFTVILGFSLGTLAGLVGGILDSVISLVADILSTIPLFPVQLIIAAIFPFQGTIPLAIILSILTWGPLALTVRGSVLSLKQRDFVLICRIMGLPKSHIIFREMFPNLTSFVMMIFVNGIHGAIGASVGLMMMGMVAINPTHWIIILNNAMSQVAGGMNTAAIWSVMVPTLGFFFLQMSLIMFATGLDEAMNPRLRGAKKVKKPKKQRTQVTGGAASGA